MTPPSIAAKLREVADRLHGHALAIAALVTDEGEEVESGSEIFGHDEATIIRSLAGEIEEVAKIVRDLGGRDCEMDHATVAQTVSL